MQAEKAVAVAIVKRRRSAGEGRICFYEASARCDPGAERSIVGFVPFTLTTVTRDHFIGLVHQPLGLGNAGPQGVLTLLEFACVLIAERGLVLRHVAQTNERRLSFPLTLRLPGP